MRARAADDQLRAGRACEEELRVRGLACGLAHDLLREPLAPIAAGDDVHAIAGPQRPAGTGRRSVQQQLPWKRIRPEHVALNVDEVPCPRPQIQQRDELPEGRPASDSHEPLPNADGERGV